MKRILAFSCLFIILFAFMAYGITGSGAWFTDQVDVENNSITTGNIDLVISDVVKSTPTLEPGGDYQEVLRFCVKNGGSYNMKWRGILTGVHMPDGMGGKILMRAISNPTKEFSGNYGAANTIWFKDRPASDLMEANPYILLDSTTNPDPFHTNDQICYSLQAKLSGSVDNEFKQKSFTATLQVDATQWISTDSGWSE